MSDSKSNREALVILSKYVLKMKQAGRLDHPISIKVKKPGGGGTPESLQVLSLFETCLNKLEEQLRSPRPDTRSSLFYSFEKLGLAMEEIASQKSPSRVTVNDSASLPTRLELYNQIRRLKGFLDREFLLSTIFRQLEKDEIGEKLKAIQQAREILKLSEPSASPQVSMESLQAEIARLAAALERERKSLLEQQSRIRELEESLSQQSEAQPGARSSDQESELHELRSQLEQVRSDLKTAREDAQAARLALTDAERARDEAVRTVRTQQSLLQDRKAIEEDRTRLQTELGGKQQELAAAQQQIGALEEGRRQMQATLVTVRADAGRVPTLKESIRTLEGENKNQAERIRTLEQQGLAKERAIETLRAEKQAADNQRQAAEAQRQAAIEAQTKAEAELAQLKAALARLRGSR